MSAKGKGKVTIWWGDAMWAVRSDGRSMVENVSAEKRYRGSRRRRNMATERCDAAMLCRPLDWKDQRSILNQGSAFGGRKINCEIRIADMRWSTDFSARLQRWSYEEMETFENIFFLINNRFLRNLEGNNSWFSDYSRNNCSYRLGNSTFMLCIFLKLI